MKINLCLHSASLFPKILYQNHTLTSFLSDISRERDRLKGRLKNGVRLFMFMLSAVPFWLKIEININKNSEKEKKRLKVKIEILISEN